MYLLYNFLGIETPWFRMVMFIKEIFGLVLLLLFYKYLYYILYIIIIIIIIIIYLYLLYFD